MMKYYIAVTAVSLICLSLQTQQGKMYDMQYYYSTYLRHYILFNDVYTYLHDTTYITVNKWVEWTHAELLVA